MPDAEVRVMHASAALLGEDARAALGEGLRLVIGAVWLLAAIGKARTRGATRDSVLRLLGDRPWAVPIATRLLVPCELLLAVMLIARWHARLAALSSASLFALFAVLLGRAAVRDALADGGGGCGCFGTTRTVLASDQSAAPRAIARNLVLAALAVAAMTGA